MQVNLLYDITNILMYQLTPSKLQKHQKYCVERALVKNRQNRTFKN